MSVEVVLTAGRSKTDRVQFNEQVAATRAMIGAATMADWCIAAPGLDAQHAEIAWDGTQLWVRDNGSRAGTWVGSEKLTQEWRVLRAGEQVRLGQAMLSVQSSGAAGGDDEEFADEATRVNPAGGGIAKAPSSDHDDGENTMIVNTADHQAKAAPSAPARPATMPPRINTVPPKINVTKPAGIQPAPSSNVATMVGDEMSGMAAYAQSLQAQVNGAAPPANPGMQAGMQQPVNPMGGYAPANPMAGGYAPANPMGGYGPANPIPPPTGDFGPPPSEMSLFGSIPPPEGSTPKPQAQQKLLFGALPPRTAIMLTGALIVALVVIVMPDDPPPPRPARRVDPALTLPQPPWQPPIPGPAAGDSRVIHLNSSRVVAPPPLPPGTRPPRNAPPPPPQTSFPERQAADFVVQNRIREAIPLYQALQTAHPDQPVYRDMLILLYRKLEAQACPPGSPTPCPNVPAMPALAPAPTVVPTPAAAPVQGAAPAVAPGAAPAAQPALVPTQPVAAQPAPQGVAR